uniref:Uncharacterized protein n=1 Tax=Anopheles culicifacies TaxID=139723 RepID=A0A182MUR5_9DIPT
MTEFSNNDARVSDTVGSNLRGPAKKRDVRTINSSSSDLGPPSKTNGAPPARSSAARAAAALQKRISPNITNVSHPLVPEQLKASPPSKRNMLLKRNGTANGTLPAKTPLKANTSIHFQCQQCFHSKAKVLRSCTTDRK